MNWRLKAAALRALAALPASASYAAYYAVQRALGGLRDVDAASRLAYGVQVARRAASAGRSVEGARILEVGTGRRLGVPTALWLCGAKRIVTVDLNRYLVPRLVLRDIRRIERNWPAYRGLFDGLVEPDLLDQRFGLLVRAARMGPDAAIRCLNVQYQAPADAAALTTLPSGTFDLHISVTVDEHIPADALGRIVAEGRRLLSEDGLFVHFVDPADHFAYADPSLLPVNFLRFDDDEWRRIAGNRYAYVNRLRAGDYRRLFEGAGLDILVWDTRTHQESLDALRNGFALSEVLRSRPPEDLAVNEIWLVARPGRRAV